MIGGTYRDSVICATFGIKIILIAPQWWMPSMAVLLPFLPPFPSPACSLIKVTPKCQRHFRTETETGTGSPPRVGQVGCGPVVTCCCLGCCPTVDDLSDWLLVDCRWLIVAAKGILMSTWNCLRDAGKFASAKMNYVVRFYQCIDGLHSNTLQGSYVQQPFYLWDLYRKYSYHFSVILYRFFFTAWSYQSFFFRFYYVFRTYWRISINNNKWCFHIRPVAKNCFGRCLV